MDENNMANTKKTTNIDGIQFRQIPNFTNYGISSNGFVANLRTHRILTPKDFDHYSGRYNLTMSNGNRTTVNASTLIRKCYSDKIVSRFERAHQEVLS